MKLSNVVNGLSGRTLLTFEKHSPEILIGAGIIGFVGTVVLACRATVKAEDVLDVHNENMDKIEEAKEIAEEDQTGEELEYTDEDAKRDKVIIYSRTAVGMIKLYTPVIALGALSITAILVGRNILNKRYLGAVAAYNGVSAAFQKYRERVIAEQGEMMDHHYYYGTELETVESIITDEKGKKKKVETVVEKPLDPSKTQQNCDGIILTALNCTEWDDNCRDIMIAGLRARVSKLNCILHTRGHVFLNEVLNDIGCDDTPEGCVVGWLNGDGDGYIDLGLDNMNNVRPFLKREIDYLPLTFNHDGVIWDKI